MKSNVMPFAAGLLSAMVSFSCLAADAPASSDAKNAVNNPFPGPAINELYKQISPFDINDNPIRLIGKDWMLITAGTPEKFNSMTASWGGFGVWNKPVAFILVHPNRYTYQFLEKNDYYTLSFYNPAKYRPALDKVFGHMSGRDVDKVKESGFTPIFTNPGVAYSEANMIIVCKKGFTAESQNGKAHKVFFGEIVSVWVKK